ncbi:MAG TPA: hypothetical protein VHQ90_21225 [Thermoanaerobaculia bacterium]|nr:hypothetical protein [Thermoanaerobaculia bacterium]
MISLLRAALALVAALASPSSPAPVPICDATTAVTLIGMDTDSGRMLFSVPAARQGGPAWVVELDGAASLARAHPDPMAGRFGGSVGPGPILAAVPCGSGCVQAIRWSDGTWEPVGDPLAVPTASTLAATYDNAGGAWLLVHAAGDQAGQVKAWGFRLEDRQWKAKGGIATAAVGQPQALPAPQRRDGVVSGTALFSASGRPSTWVTGLPDLPPNRRGQVLALTGTSAAYVSADGVVYLSADSGKGWRRSTWTPWGSDTVGMWRQGSDYGVDLPFGDHRGSLQLVWFDRRNPAEERVLLARLEQDGRWLLVAEAASEVRSKNGDRLPVSQVLVPRRDTWVLLSGCAATAGGSGLVLRVAARSEVSAPRFLPIALAAKAPPPG